MSNIEIHEGSGNVFEDLGFENAKEELAKANLAACIYEILKKRKLTQTQAAKILGIDQPKISALKNGRCSGFSIERLFSFLLALGQDIEVTTKPSPRYRPADLSVHSPLS